MFEISHLNSSELIAFASTLAIFIGQNVSTNDAGILANFFSALGDNLGIISSTGSNSNLSITNSSSMKYL